MERDEPRIIEAVLQGAADQFRVLVERYQKPIYSLMLRLTGSVPTAEDLTQEEIHALGERFDPNFHEAVETRVEEGTEEGIVLEELRKGYRFQGQLLRPAMVRVSVRGESRTEGKA